MVAAPCNGGEDHGFTMLVNWHERVLSQLLHPEASTGEWRYNVSKVYKSTSKMDFKFDLMRDFSQPCLAGQGQFQLVKTI
jgi:hypothetical protein